MTWSTATKCLCHKWPRICSVCRNHNPVLPHSWLITEFVTRDSWRVSHVEQKMFNLPENWSSSLDGVHVPRSLVFCVVFCRSLFVPFPLATVLSVLLQFTDSDYPFGIFKLFFNKTLQKLQLNYGHIMEWAFSCRMLVDGWFPLFSTHYHCMLYIQFLLCYKNITIR